jgi:D-alanyl-D-alanine-carboxypeptidase/D-alanyl-D-alanine-endopeptidase
MTSTFGKATRTPNLLRALVASMLLVGMASMAFAAPALAIIGDWTGALRPPAQTLHLALHVTADAAGNLGVALDSLDQKAMGLPGSNVILKGNDFSFDIPSVHGSYKGTLSADGKTIKGSWSQGTSLPLQFVREAGASADSHAPVGDWSGALQVSGQTLRVAVHVVADAAGTLSVTLDSLDQKAMGLPGSNVLLKGSDFSFDVPSVHGNYRGTISADGKTIKGIWNQGMPLPLDLARQTNANADPRVSLGRYDPDDGRSGRQHGRVSTEYSREMSEARDVADSCVVTFGASIAERAAWIPAASRPLRRSPTSGKVDVAM